MLTGLHPRRSEGELKALMVLAQPGISFLDQEAMYWTLEVQQN
jgi:hypothetical protein